MALSNLYGFMQLADLARERVTVVGDDVIANAIEQSRLEYERQIATTLGIFAMPTTLEQARFQSVTARRLQPLDENGRARPTKPAGYYSTAFPIQMAGDAWGANWVTRAKMTVEEAARITSGLFIADTIWLRDHIFAALFASATWTFADPFRGDLTVQPLANGDTVTYQLMTGASVAATDTHQLAQAAAIADATNPYPTIYTELSEHPENSGQVVAFIPTNQKATTEALATFHPLRDANIQPGSGSDVLVGTLDVAVPGTLIGYEDSGVFIVEWPSLPDNYIVATTTGGDKALAMREDPEPELRGFRQVGTRDDHPYWESQWARRAGFGTWNRVGALVYRIGNASYAVPTGYDSPLA